MPEERDLLLKIVGQVVRPVVVTQPQPHGPRLSPMPPKRSRMPWRIGSEGLEAVPALGGMEPDACGRRSDRPARRRKAAPSATRHR